MEYPLPLAAAAPGGPLLSICVLTYRRPVLLARALRSIGLQGLPPEVEIVISDNAPATEPEAEHVARILLAACPPAQWRYDRNPPGGTVLTNTSHCLARARGAYLYVLHDDDYLLPQGLDTPVGEGGYGLSGGQAQRVAIARAFVRNAPLLLLDEPTAHLDPATEADVLDSLRRLALGRTVILASHSAAAHAFAGRRLMLSGGQARMVRGAA